jgi:uncharacterized damage-inducible protein DinB
VPLSSCRACVLFSIVPQGILRARWIQAGRIIDGVPALGTEMSQPKQPEPWLRGALAEVPAVHRAVLHALQLAEEDLTRWCADLTAEELNARPAGMASAAFHIRHIARSIDRLLTYSEGRQLTEVQMASLRMEMNPDATPEYVFAELHNALELARNRVRALVGADLEANRMVGRQALPTTLGGLLVHVADHTQRHVGQAITTTKFVRAARST